jgi:hypothetical protein
MSIFYFMPWAFLCVTFSYAQTFNCAVTIPPNPLTAAGLASVYKVTGCNQIDFANQGTFVEAAILDPATGAIQIYHPLVINQDKNVAGVDFVTPSVPTLPANAVVGIWFGSNANTIQLLGTTQGCVNGLGNSVFGQFAYCNGPVFFAAAQAAVAAGLLTIPPPGTSTKVNTVKYSPQVYVTPLSISISSMGTDFFLSRQQLRRHALFFETSGLWIWTRVTTSTPPICSSVGNNWRRILPSTRLRTRRTLQVQ